MKKLALNFICRNEAHVIEGMLVSAKSVTDLIVACDTGSTDGTQELIRQFGLSNHIPTCVLERPFDNFSNSRNYALEKAREFSRQLGWDLEQVWGYYFDCDEKMVLSPSFDKESLDKDVYYVMGQEGGAKFTRINLFRLSSPLRWYGPVHEAITWTDPSVTSAQLPGLCFVHEKTGHSWKEHRHEKYYHYARMLEDFITHEDRSPRWVFFTAQSYYGAAVNCVDPTDRLLFYQKARQYYVERVAMEDDNMEDQFYAQFVLGDLGTLLRAPWEQTQEALLKAYAIDPLRAEPFQKIIQHYLECGDWQMAYFFSKFAKETFHGRNPLGIRYLNIDEPLYNWQLLNCHAMICHQLGLIPEYLSAFRELQGLTRTHPEYFSKQDLAFIKTQKNTR